MKKIIVAIATFTSLILTVKLHAHGILECLDPFSTLGVLTTCSDAAGIGTVIPTEEPNFDILVDTPLFGCTNQQLVAVNVHASYFGYGEYEYLPTNGQRIVFLVHTNLYYSMNVGDWNIDIEQRQREGGKDDFETSDFRLEHATRSWFEPDLDDGLVFTHLTNVVHTMRTERNWTNYYEVVRSGVISPSERVSKDSRSDLLDLIQFADPAQLLLMKNDPLFPVELKDLLPK